jgi:hypothetical protein
VNGEDEIETGFDDPAITATVTNGLTPAGLDALKAMVAMPKQFGPPEMVALARDLATNIHPLRDILLKHNLTNIQYEFISEHNEFFKKTLQVLSLEWQGVTKTADRLRMQAQAALEAQLPSIASRMGKQSEKLIDAVEAAKLFAKIGDVDGGTDRGNASGERFTISIDLGADARLVIGNAGGTKEGAGSITAGEVHRDTEGGSKTLTLQPNPERS